MHSQRIPLDDVFLIRRIRIRIAVVQRCSNARHSSHGTQKPATKLHAEMVGAPSIDGTTSSSSSAGGSSAVTAQSAPPATEATRSARPRPAGSRTRILTCGARIALPAGCVKSAATSTANKSESEPESKLELEPHKRVRNSHSIQAGVVLDS